MLGTWIIFVWISLDMENVIHQIIQLLNPKAGLRKTVLCYNPTLLGPNQICWSIELIRPFSFFESQR